MAAATVICAMTVAPPRPTRLLSRRMTDAPFRAAAIAAYIPAPPAPTISTSVVRWGITAGDWLALKRSAVAPALIRSLREWIGTKLELDDLRLRSFATFYMKRRAGACGCPEAFALPAGFGIVDPTVHPLSIEAQWIGHAQVDEFSVHHGQQRIVQVAGGDGHIL